MYIREKIGDKKFQAMEIIVAGILLGAAALIGLRKAEPKTERVPVKNQKNKIKSANQISK